MHIALESSRKSYRARRFLKGEVDENPRKEIFYFDQAGNLNALRYQDWKLHFTLMEGAINEAYRKQPAWPILFNLRADPYEVSHESALYIRWFADQMWTFVPAQAITAEFLATFKDYPPVMGSSLGIDKVVQSFQTLFHLFFTFMIAMDDHYRLS